MAGLSQKSEFQTQSPLAFKSIIMKEFLVSQTKKLIQKALSSVDDIEVFVTFENSIAAELLNQDIRFQISAGVLKVGIRAIFESKMINVSFMDLNIDEICSVLKQTRNSGTKPAFQNFYRENTSMIHHGFDEKLHRWANDGNILKAARNTNRFLAQHKKNSMIESHEGSISYHSFMKLVATKEAMCILDRNGLIVHSILNSARENQDHFFTFHSSSTLSPSPDENILSFFDSHIQSLQSHEVSPDDIETHDCPVIFHPYIAEDLFRIVAQEKFLGSSFHAKTTHLQCSDKIFPENFSLYNNPDIIGWNQTPFDDEQVRTKKFPIVENGIMKQFLSSRSSANLQNIEPCGNGIRRPVLIEDITDAPVRDSMIGLEICEGKQHSSEIISKMKNAIIVNNVLGLHGADISRSAFSTTISDGFAVKNGEIIGTLKPGKWNISGSIFGDSSIFRNVQCSKERILTGTGLIPYLVTTAKIS